MTDRPALTAEDVHPLAINHKPTCPAPLLKVRPGREPGVWIVSCRKCSTLALADEHGQRIPTGTAPTSTTPAAPTASPSQRYRCPTHGTAVTWRGTGCEPCQHDRDTYRARRIERRAAAALTHHA